MKTLAQFDGVEFLKRCNKIRKDVQAFLQETKILSIRKNTPTLTGNETKEEIKEKNKAQAMKNINDMLDVMLDKYPERTLDLFRLFIELEDGEKEPTGMELVLTGMNLFTDERIVDFLASLIRLGQTNISG